MKNLLGIIGLCLILIGCDDSSSLPATTGLNTILGEELYGTTEYRDMHSVFIMGNSSDVIMTFNYTEVIGGSINSLQPNMSIIFWADFSAWIYDNQGILHFCYFPYKIMIQ